MRLERRLEPSAAARIAMPLAAVLAGLLAGALVIEAGGNDAINAYGTMFAASLGSESGWQATLTQAAPLMLTALAVAIPARMRLWNIGGEGQLTIGAAAATGVGLFVSLPGALLPIGMLLGAMAAAGGWALIAALPRALFGLNEIIVTLFLNYIAIQLMSYLVNGPWGDRSAIGFAFTPAIPDRANLPLLTGSLGVGVLIAVAAALVAAWIANRTPFGLTIQLVGTGTRLPEYLQLGVKRLIIAGLGASGALAGLAGAIQVMGVTQRLEPGISSNYGYSGILVAFLAAGSVLGVVAGAVVYGALIVGGLALQGIGVPFDVSLVVQALIILFVLCGQAALRYRIRLFLPA